MKLLSYVFNEKMVATQVVVLALQKYIIMASKCYMHFYTTVVLVNDC